MKKIDFLGLPSIMEANIQAQDLDTLKNSMK